jgi:hypothetical protein
MRGHPPRPPDLSPAKFVLIEQIVSQEPVPLAHRLAVG